MSKPIETCRKYTLPTKGSAKQFERIADLCRFVQASVRITRVVHVYPKAACFRNDHAAKLDAVAKALGGSFDRS